MPTTLLINILLLSSGLYDVTAMAPSSHVYRESYKYIETGRKNAVESDNIAESVPYIFVHNIIDIMRALTS